MHGGHGHPVHRRATGPEQRAGASPAPNGGSPFVLANNHCIQVRSKSPVFKKELHPQPKNDYLESIEKYPLMSLLKLTHYGFRPKKIKIEHLSDTIEEIYSDRYDVEMMNIRAAVNKILEEEDIRKEIRDINEFVYDFFMRKYQQNARKAEETIVNMLQTLEYYKREQLHLQLFGDFLMYSFTSDDISCFLLIRSLIEKELGIKIVSLDKKHVEDLTKVALSRKQARRVFDNFMVDEPPQLVERSFNMFVRQSQRLYNSEIIRPYDMMIHGVKEYKQIAEKKLMSGMRGPSSFSAHGGVTTVTATSNHSYIDSCFATTFNTATKKPRESRPESNAASFGAMAGVHPGNRFGAGPSGSLQQTFGMQGGGAREQPGRGAEVVRRGHWTHDEGDWEGHSPDHSEYLDGLSRGPRGVPNASELASFGRHEPQSSYTPQSAQQLAKQVTAAGGEREGGHDSGDFVVPQFGTPVGGVQSARTLRGTSRDNTNSYAFIQQGAYRNADFSQQYAHTFRNDAQDMNEPSFSNRSHKNAPDMQGRPAGKPQFVAQGRSASPLDDRHSKESIQSNLSASSVDKQNYNTVTSVSEQCFSTLKKLLHTFVSDALKDESGEQSYPGSSGRVDPSVVEEISGIIYRKCKQLLKAVARQDMDKWMEQLMISTPNQHQIANFRNIIVEFDSLLVAYRQTGVAQEEKIQSIGRMILKAPELLNQIGKLIVHIVNTLEEFDREKMERTLENSIKKNISQISHVQAKNGAAATIKGREDSFSGFSHRGGDSVHPSTQRSGQMDALMAHLQEDDLPSEEMMAYKLNGSKRTATSREYGDGGQHTFNGNSRRWKEQDSSQQEDGSFDGRMGSKELDFKRLMELEEDEGYEESRPAAGRGESVQPKPQGCYFDSFRSKFRPAGSIINEEDGESQEPSRSVAIHEGNSKHEQSISNILNKTNILSAHERSKQSVFYDQREESEGEDEGIFERNQSPEKPRKHKEQRAKVLDEREGLFQGMKLAGQEVQQGTQLPYSSRTSKNSAPSMQGGLLTLGYHNTGQGNTPQHTGRYDTEFESGPALPGNALQNLNTVTGDSLLELEGLPLKAVHPNKPLHKYDKELEEFLAASSPGVKGTKGESGAENRKARMGGDSLRGENARVGSPGTEGRRTNKVPSWGEEFSQSHHDSKTYEAFEEDDEDPAALLDRIAGTRMLTPGLARAHR